MYIKMQTTQINENKIMLNDLSIVDLLKNSLKTYNEVNLKVTRDYIHFYGLDPANVSLLSLKIFKANCVEYGIGKDFEYSLNLQDLKDFLKSVKKTDVIYLNFDYNEIDNGILDITLNDGTLKRDFRIRLTEPRTTNKEPTLSYNTIVELDNKTYLEALKTLISKDNTFIDFDLNKDGLTLSNETNKANILIEQYNGAYSKSRYSVEYLKNFKIKGFEKVRLSFGDTFPLKIEYSLRDRYEYYNVLAPRVVGD